MGNSQQFDVAVVGGGPTGIGAAVAAGRMGLGVALIERHPVLGGMGTAGLVNNFCHAHKANVGEEIGGRDVVRRIVIGGVFGDLRRRLMGRKAIYFTGLETNDWMEPYDPDAFTEEADAMCREAGVTAFLGHSVRDAGFNGSGTKLETDKGACLAARAVVDASGDAIVAAKAGVPFTFGRPRDNGVMPLTYCFTVGPIDIEKVKREMPLGFRVDPLTGDEVVFVTFDPKIEEWIRLARDRGELTIPRKSIVSITSIPGRREFGTVNFGRVFCKDPTDPDLLAEAETEGKRQVDEAVRFFQKYLPGFENAGLVELARQIGVRETRQIIGLYTLTGQDALEGRQFEDVIAQCAYPVDIHEPGSEHTTLERIRGTGHYDIPWRCLVPREGPPNLIVGGRCISGTQEAMASFRVSPSVMAIGEAAGVTASLAVRRGCAIADVPVEAVQDRLRETEGILE
ncbi:MAG: FAD-dependent oxidoreductase [Terrimicrobiaceae bacterium]